MLTYSFEGIGSVSLYEHLYRSIRDDILSGKLRPGERLPSKRPFAANLGVSTITVENAYAQLQAEGYIYTLPKKGCYVSRLSDRPVPAAPAPVLSPAPAPQEKLLDLSDSGVLARDFPFTVWSAILRDLLRSHRDELMARSPGPGIPALRQAIAGHLQSFRGMTVQPGQIIIGAGTEYLYGLLIQLLGRNACYAVEDPGYGKIRRVYESQGVRCVPVAMDSRGLQPKLLQDLGAGVVHITPGHHFPTGIVMPVSRRYELLAWASDGPDRYIIEDDYDSEFRFTGRVIPTLQSIDASGRVIYVNTFTKTLASTMRISYMVLPLGLVSRFHSLLGFYACTVPNMDQYALAEFLSKGYFENHLNRMRRQYRIRRDRLLEGIRKAGIPSDSIRGQDAGLHFLIDIDTSLTDEALCACALRHGLNIRPLSGCYADPAKVPAHTFIISYSALSEDMLDEAAARLADVIREAGNG